jgi:uncharacterized membrane protein YfcA
MQYLIGFVIALFIALTGVGAGTITVPVLVLFLGVDAPVAVGIGLMFATAVKLILVPAQIARRNVAWKTLGFMVAGGVPGVIIGSLFLKHLVTVGSQNLMNALLGFILVTTAAWQIANSFKPIKANENARDRSPLLAWLMLPVGAEVGFVISLIGSGAHWFSHASNNELLLQLIAGGVFGAITGTLLSARVPRRPLRFALWVWLLILGGQFLFNSYHVWAAPKRGVAPVHTALLK